MKKWFTYCLRLLVLLVLTCNMWGVLFARTETLTGPYSLSSNKTVASNDTLVINGNLTIQDNKTLTVKSNAVLLVKGNLTISSKGSLVLETPSTLLVTGNLTQKESLGFFVVYTGGVSANGALIVIEGNYVVETLLGLNESAAIDAGKNDVYVFGESTFSSNNYGDQDDL
ncbi:MAG: hypothetical protein J6V74_02850, partial [Bacteroidales bacterium]|nr:hypothetical protein [Bacteroidales bacterium]